MQSIGLEIGISGYSAENDANIQILGRFSSGISLVSNEGNGSRLPPHAPAPAFRRNRIRHPNPRQHPMIDSLSPDVGAPTEVGIIEGDVALGENLRRSLESVPGTRCIGVWNTAEKGLRSIDALRPKIVLMDIDPPGMSGIKATALLKRFLPETQVIIISTDDDRERIHEALRAGACGFLYKPSGLVPSIARRVSETLLNHRPAPDGTGSLTDREAQVAGLIAEGLTNKEIGVRLNISTQTVHGYTKIIFRKLNVRSRTEVAVRQLTAMHERELCEPTGAPPLSWR